MALRLAIGGALAIAAIPAAAMEAKRAEKVEFARGTSSRTIKGVVKGYETVEYLIDLRAGQTLSVGMKTSNASSYFNIQKVGVGEAMFVGSIGGSSFTGKIPATGQYAVAVYLMRNAARRAESANYTVTIAAR